MSTIEVVDPIEIFDTSKADYEVTIGDRLFWQTPLSFFRKVELFSVLADAIDKALADGAVISELLEDVPSGTSDLKDADVFIKAIAKVMRFAPDLLSDIFCISLNVKRNERKEVKELFEEMSDEQAVEIMNHFIDQNWDAMMDFFSKQMKPLIAKVSEKVQLQSTSSTPSNPSRRNTRKK